MKQITFGGNKNVIGKRLSVLRKEKGITQSDLAARMQTLNVNIDQQMIGKIEKISGRLRIMNLPAFANAWLLNQMKS